MIREPRVVAVAYSFWSPASLAMALAPGFVNGEARAEQQLKFEVASVKPSAMQETRCDGEAGQPAAGGMPCHHVHGGKGRGLDANAATISDIAQNVANSADRLLLDRTGLKDLYRGELT